MVLVTAAERAIEFADAELDVAGLSWRDWRMLSVIDVLEPISQSALAERIGIDRTTASRAVRDLKQRSLVVALTGSRDLRRRELYLTAEGSSVLRAASVGLGKAEAQFFARLGNVSWRRLHDQLAHLAPRRGEPALGHIPFEVPRLWDKKPVRQE
jgi:DNA-binding MarR family transcriptional regulator